MKASLLTFKCSLLECFELPFFLSLSSISIHLCCAFQNYNRCLCPENLFIFINSVVDALDLFLGFCFPKKFIISFLSSLQIVTENGMSDQMRLTELILKDVSYKVFLSWPVQFSVICLHSLWEILFHSMFNFFFHAVTSTAVISCLQTSASKNISIDIF